MSSRNLGTSHHTESTRSLVDTHSKRVEGKGMQREKLFTRVDNPFLVDQHVFTIVLMVVSHIFLLHSCYLFFYRQVPRSAIVFELSLGYIAGFGVTVGCHRYWTHKTFKATLPMQIMLMILQTMAAQGTIHRWCLIHRIHHKYTDTDADPHNSKRGFFYSHLGWLVLAKSKEQRHALDTFDMSDLETDPIVRFQSRWYWTLTAIFHLIIPIAILYYVWGIPLFFCLSINRSRHIISLHFAFTVNSVAHIWGDKPYDKNISSVDNSVVSVLAIGEGWHNYHHTFPWDYKASEFGWKINLSTMFIDFFAKIGWVYDLKTVSQTMLKKRLQRTGDGSHNDGMDKDKIDFRNDFDYCTPANTSDLMKSVDQPIWGWDDEDLSDDLRKVTKILEPKSM